MNRQHSVWLIAACLIATLTPVRADDDWVGREKIRAGWIFAGDGVERLAFFKRRGMNCLILHAGNREAFGQWATEAKRTEMRLIGVVGASFDGQAAGMRPCVFGNGYESVVPCPVEPRYWDEVLTRQAVEVAREGQDPAKAVAGILIDWEMYVNSTKGGQIYYSDACYCDHCFGGYLKANGLDVAPVPYKERVAWLKNNGLHDGYQPRLQEQVRALAGRLREAVEAVDPEFLLGFYPVPHNWHLIGVAQGLGTPAHPMILWATSTYGGGGPAKVPDDWRRQMRAQGIHARYSGGVLLRMYSAANLAANLYEIARKSDGYWIFPVHTLCLPEAKQRGDFHLCAGTPEEYLTAIEDANRELDNLAWDGEYQTSLKLVDEPVRYRHPGFDLERFKAPKLVDRSTAPRGQPMAVPPLDLTVTSYMMMSLDSGESPSLVFEVVKRPSGEVWGVSYAVLGPDGQQLSAGRMTPGEPFTLGFTAKLAGLHTVVLSPGYYGRCRVLTTTVPYAHWTWTSYPPYEVAGPGGRLYFHVPRGLDRFTLMAQCPSGATGAQVQITVFDPAGRVAADQPTDELVRNATLTVPTAGQDGGLWSVRLAAVKGKSYPSLILKWDDKLPPAVTVRREFVFEEGR